jgi:hypothetical protein
LSIQKSSIAKHLISSVNGLMANDHLREGKYVDLLDAARPGLW